MLEGSEEKIQWLLQEYMPQLRFITEPHKKCLVLFSGVPGSGKTLAAEKIEQSLLGVRISNDEMRALLFNRWPDLAKEANKLVREEVMRRIFARLQTSGNGLVIIDASIDRSYDFYKGIADTYNYPAVMLRFDVPFDVLRRRIIDRPEKSNWPRQYFLDNLDSWWADWKKFGENRQFDLTVTPDTKLSEVVLAVVNKLSSLQSNSSSASQV